MKHVVYSMAVLVLISAASSASARNGDRVVPTVRTYKVQPGLSNVANLRIFRKELSAREKAVLAKNMFVVAPTDYVQLSDVYENNDYRRPLKYPSFITTDSLAHTYHLFYDYSLRTVEGTKLFPACEKLTEAMLARSRSQYASSTGEVKKAAERNVAYFLVAKALLTKSTPATSLGAAQSLAKADLAKIQAHSGPEVAASVGSRIDFSQFVPRGHYTRTETLRRYFKAMMWYGLVPFDIRDDGQTRQALLIARALRADREAFRLWQTIYEPTVFYVGNADDLTATQYGLLSDRAFGANSPNGALASKSRLAAFRKALRALPGPRIATAALATTNGKQFRFMGQRFIADSRILQELTDPKVAGRIFPMGLDVFAALGSDRALHILRAEYKQDRFGGYAGQMNKMRSEIAAITVSTWESNLYFGWLWALKTMTTVPPAGYPSFMRNPAWQDKNLLTGLGSWTELRHDTILYAKESAAEGGDGEEKEPPLPKGYVEPNLDFWLRIQRLNEATLKGLRKRNLLSAKLKDSFEKIGDLIEFCRRISVKELTGAKVKRNEYQRMTEFGSELNGLFMDFAGGNLISEADLDMALVADVHTGGAEVLEEGTGHAGVIYVVVPIEGKLYITRGAMFTQYEFHQPISDRLADAAWQERLNQNKQPRFAEWTRGFLIPTVQKQVDDSSGE